MKEPIKPKHTITIDFETYYDTEYSLTKMTTAQYVYDSWFEVIGFAYKVDSGLTQWVSGYNEVFQTLHGLPWEESICVAHNAAFDGLILSCHHCKPLQYFCTSMAARPLVAPVRGNTKLATVADYFGVGVKGDEVVNARGKHRGDFSTEELARYGAYCKNDVNLTYMIYNLLLAWYERENVNVA